VKHRVVEKSSEADATEREQIGGDRMSSAGGNPYAHNYAIPYSFHLLRWLRGRARRLRVEPENKVREKNPKANESIQKSASTSSQINIAELGILKGSGLAFWSILFPLLVERVWGDSADTSNETNTGTNTHNDKFDINTGKKSDMSDMLMPSLNLFAFDFSPHVFEQNRPFLERKGAFKQLNPKTRFFDQVAQSPTEQAVVFAEALVNGNGTKRPKHSVVIDDALHTETAIIKSFWLQ
jgi:hypothetical protein